MSTLHFTKEPEWVRIKGDTATCGISDYAQKQLGDIVAVDLPDPGRTVEQFKEIAAVDSVKAASDIFAPVSGEVIEVNTALEQQPELINGDAQGAGWLFKLKVRDAGELSALMDEAAYKSYLEGLA